MGPQVEENTKQENPILCQTFHPVGAIGYCNAVILYEYTDNISSVGSSYLLFPEWISIFAAMDDSDSEDKSSQSDIEMDPR